MSMWKYVIFDQTVDMKAWPRENIIQKWKNWRICPMNSETDIYGNTNLLERSYAKQCVNVLLSFGMCSFYYL